MQRHGQVLAGDHADEEAADEGVAGTERVDDGSLDDRLTPRPPSVVEQGGRGPAGGEGEPRAAGHGVGEEVEGAYARVSVEIVSARSVDIPVAYSLKKQDGTWLIYDVAVEGVRLVNNYRSQFNSMLDGMPYAKFIAKLRDKVKAIQEEK